MRARWPRALLAIVLQVLVDPSAGGAPHGHRHVMSQIHWILMQKTDVRDEPGAIRDGSDGVGDQQVSDHDAALLPLTGCKVPFDIRRKNNMILSGTAGAMDVRAEMPIMQLQGDSSKLVGSMLLHPECDACVLVVLCMLQTLYSPETFRRLQQDTTSTGDVTVVTTAEGLQEAVAEGLPHIEIQAHLDLTTLDTVTCDIGECLLGVGADGYIPSTVQSIKVCCCSALKDQSSAR